MPMEQVLRRLLRVVDVPDPHGYKPVSDGGVTIAYCSSRPVQTGHYRMVVLISRVPVGFADGDFVAVGRGLQARRIAQHRGHSVRQRLVRGIGLYSL